LMGIYAEVTEGGPIAVGDRLTVGAEGKASCGGAGDRRARRMPGGAGQRNRREIGGAGPRGYFPAR